MSSVRSAYNSLRGWTWGESNPLDIGVIMPYHSEQAHPDNYHSRISEENNDEEYIYDEVRIDQIEPGDEVLSRNEKTDCENHKQ